MQFPISQMPVQLESPLLLTGITYTRIREVPWQSLGGNWIPCTSTIKIFNFLSAEVMQNDNTATLSLSSICKLNVPQCHKWWYLLSKITFTQQAMQRKHFYTTFLTIQSCFWIFPNLGTMFYCTTLLLFGIIALCHSRSHCWSSVLFDWWHRVLLGKPLSWATVVYQCSQRSLSCETTSFPDVSWGSWIHRLLLLIQLECAPYLQLPWGPRLITETHLSSTANTDLQFNRIFFFSILKGQVSTSAGSDSQT